MSSLEHVNQQLADIDQQLKKPLPTPNVGTMVHWFQRNIQGEGREVAAVVTKVEGPGQVELTVFPPKTIPIHKQGVLHVNHPIHQQRGHSSSVNCGSWDYINGVPRGDYELHTNKLNQRREAVIADWERFKEAQENKRLKAEAEAAAAAGK